MSIRKAQCEAAWTLAARDGQAHLSLLPNATITHDCMLRARSGRSGADLLERFDERSRGLLGLREFRHDLPEGVAAFALRGATFTLADLLGQLFGAGLKASGVLQRQGVLQLLDGLSCLRGPLAQRVQRVSVR